MKRNSAFLHLTLDIGRQDEANYVLSRKQKHKTIIALRCCHIVPIVNLVAVSFEKSELQSDKQTD